jgi:divalent metal cation (Fe/Co/Zn/Cd) transporter
MAKKKTITVTMTLTVSDRDEFDCRQIEEKVDQLEKEIKDEYGSDAEVDVMVNKGISKG